MQVTAESEPSVSAASTATSSFAEPSRTDAKPRLAMLLDSSNRECRRLRRRRAMDAQLTIHNDHRAQIQRMEGCDRVHTTVCILVPLDSLDSVE
jgi:hypothetical protein